MDSVPVWFTDLSIISGSSSLDGLLFLYKEKLDNMVVFHVSTFILQLYSAGGFFLNMESC